METRAAVLYDFPAPTPYAQSRPLRIETVTLAPPGPQEVLVRLKAAGLCHSDLSVINGDRPRPMPMALGHEAAGIVEACGEGVDDLVVGDHVIMVFMPSCGACGRCVEGRPSLCGPGLAANVAGTLLSGARRLSRNGRDIHHHVGVSAFAEHAVVSRRSLVKIDRDLPFEIAALFGCAVLTGMGAMVNTAKVRAGESVAIVGLGGVGLAGVLGAVACGAGTVIATDVNPQKLSLARELGATHVFDARDEATVEAIRSLTDGGVDHALETAGVVPALELAYEATRRGGQTVTVSLANPDARLPIAPVRLVAEERTLRGSFLGGGVPSRDILRYIALHRQGRLPVEKLHTGTSDLDGINAGFDRLAQGEAIRHLIAFG